MSLVKEYSVFPNGDRIKNDRLTELLEVVYDLMETHDGQTVLFMLLHKVKFGRISPLYPKGRKIKLFKDFMKEELCFLTKKGEIPRDVRNLLSCIEEVAGLHDKIFLKLTCGKRFSRRIVLSLDQYCPKENKVFPAKNSWKAKSDSDYRRELGPSICGFLDEI